MLIRGTIGERSSDPMTLVTGIVLGLTLALGGIPGCGNDDDSPPPPTVSPTGVEILSLGSVTLSPNSSSQELTVEVNSSSLMLVADGGRARDIDISSVKDPQDTVLVTENFNDIDPIGKNLLQAAGQSTASGLFPHTPHYYTQGIPVGPYKFKVANFDASTQSVRVLAIINHREQPSGGILAINVLFCGIADLTAVNAPTLASFQPILGEFARIYQQANVQVAVAGYFDCPSHEADRLSSIQSSDFNQNLLADELEDLLFLSSSFPVGALNIFIVRNVDGGLPGFTIAGQSAGIPGPGPLNGTVHSGVVMSLGTDRIATLTQGDLLRRGRTMAHESGHYLGLFHTTESSGSNGTVLRVDPIQDTPECPTSRDVNMDGNTDADECADFGGLNLMFWTQPAPPAVRDQLTAGQMFVVHRSPNVQ